MTTHPSEPRRPARALLGFAVGVALAAGVGAVIWFVTRPPADKELATPPAAPSRKEEDCPPAFFRDVTRDSGVTFLCRNGEEANQFTLLETLGGGVALIDHDGDGLLDLFLVGGGGFGGPDKKQLVGHPCKLYRNLGGFRFADVTKDVGLDAVAWWYTHGAAVADYDRDGWPDLLVTGFGRLALFRNVDDGKGGRRFVDVTKDVGLRDDSWSTSAGWADLDGDGYPDLYVCHYTDWSMANNPVCKGQVPGVERDVCPPQQFKPLAHALFRNDKGRAFTDETANQKFKPDGCGLGVVLVDVNADGKPDVYVANDASPNFLFVNRSSGKLALEEKGVDAGVAVNESGTYDGSMGVDAADFDGSGRASLWVTNYQGDLHGLYANRGSERFDHVTRAAGVGAIGMHWVGFGTAFLDVDGDGWEDLIVVNGHVLRHPPKGSTFRQRAVLLHNQEVKGLRFFKDASVRGGAFCEVPALGRGLAVGDLDNDGWPDVVVSNTNTHLALERNAAVEKSHRWIGLHLAGQGSRDVVGSTVTLELEDGRKLTRFLKGGGSYLSANDPRLLVGLGEAGKVKSVRVRWSWGKTETWDGLTAGRYWRLVEGTKEATEMKAR